MKIQSPWMGRVRGSAGNMTGCKIYNKNVLRAKAFEVANPKTAAQMMQRNFMKQVIDVTKTVSEEQLRSLFGIKPSKMSRRNALSQQIAAAFTIEDGVKSVDFSMLTAIGNGKKVSVPYVEFIDGSTSDGTIITDEMLNITEGQNPNLIIIAFDNVNNKINLVNTGYNVEDGVSTYVLIDEAFDSFNGFAYVTCASDGTNVYDLPFGQFTLKTRSTKIANVTPAPEYPTVEIMFDETPITDATFQLSLSNYTGQNYVPGILYQINPFNGSKVILCETYDESSLDLYSGTLVADFNEEWLAFVEMKQSGVVQFDAPIFYDN